MEEKTLEYLLGHDIIEGIGEIRFTPGTQNYNAVVILPYSVFRQYAMDVLRPERIVSNYFYERGEVACVDRCKFLLDGDRRLNPNDPNEIPRIEGNEVKPGNLKLFRDSGRYNWVRNEYCLKGFERYFEDSNRPDKTGWYTVISARVDSSTPPPDDYQNWQKM